MKILLVTNKCPPDYDGGYELRAFETAQSLRARGHDVNLVTSHYRPGFVAQTKDPEWVHRIFQFVPVSSKTGFARKVDAATRRIACTTIAEQNEPAMREFLKGRHYDLAYCFGMHRIGLATAYPLTERGIPILWHAGGTYLVDQLYRWPKEILGFRAAMGTVGRKWYQIERNVDYSNVAFVSQFLCDYHVEHGMKVPHPYVIGLRADFPLQTDVDRERAQPPLFFMASRLDREKGIHTAVAAAAMLLQKRPDLNWRLEIAGNPGDPQYRQELDEQVAAASLQERVSFLGQVPLESVLAKMREATAFLSCSRYGEAFAGTIMESLASGTPLLGSIDGSIREVVEDEESALLFDKDDSAKLAQHMERVLTHPDLAQRLALGGLQVMRERFTVEKILDQTEAAFADVLSRQRPKAVA